MKRLWSEYLFEWARALRSAPQLLHRTAFRPRTIEEELVEASLQGSLKRTLGFYDLLSLVRARVPLNQAVLPGLAGSCGHALGLGASQEHLVLSRRVWASVRGAVSSF